MHSPTTSTAPGVQKKLSAPLNDEIITAVSQLVDDAQGIRRDPSHSDLTFQIERASVADGDPAQAGQNVGKAKRIRATLSSALENNPQAGGHLVAALISCLRGHGGFRESSSNYSGKEAIKNAIAAFASEGYELTLEGELRPMLLDGLDGVALTDALNTYVRRAQRGSLDAALVTGTGKDLLEAVAAHVLQQRLGTHPSTSNFPTLLGQAFIELGFATTQDSVLPNEPANRKIERASYELACAINRLRNTQGIGHGRPWLPTVTDSEARRAIGHMGIIAERMLAAL